jgi:hypothetical protein
MFRNPVVARGASAFVGYNLIVNPAENAIHFYDVGAPTPLQVSVIGNIVDAGPNTASNVTAVQVPDDMAKKNADAKIYLANNSSPAGPLTNRGGFILADSPPVVLADKVRPPDDVRGFVLRYAGERPAERDGVDKRIVSGARTGTAKVIDSPAEVGGLPDIQPVKAIANVPASPFGPSRLDGLLRIEAWLCERHLEVGGPGTPECPRTETDYRNALGPQLSQRR